MKTFLALLLSVASLNAATLKWTSPAGDPNPATGWKIQRQIPGETVWLAIATTAASGTNYTLHATNAVAGYKYRVSGTNQWGESLPSNEATVGAPPQQPGTLIIEASVETAPSPTGPWTVRTVVPLTVPLGYPEGFARSKIRIAGVPIP